MHKSDRKTPTNHQSPAKWIHLTIKMKYSWMEPLSGDLWLKRYREITEGNELKSSITANQITWLQVKVTKLKSYFVTSSSFKNPYSSRVTKYFYFVTCHHSSPPTYNPLCGINSHSGMSLIAVGHKPIIHTLILEIIHLDPQSTGEIPAASRWIRTGKPA